MRWDMWELYILSRLENREQFCSDKDASELAISMAIFDHFQLIKNIQITEEEGCFPFKSDRFYSFLSLWTNIPIDRPTNHTILKKYIFLFLLLVI